MDNVSVDGSPKYHFLKIHDGGGRHIGKYTKGYISAKSGPICTKFGTLIDMDSASHWGSKCHFLEIQDGFPSVLSSNLIRR